MHMEV